MVRLVNTFISLFTASLIVVAGVFVSLPLSIETVNAAAAGNSESPALPDAATPNGSYIEVTASSIYLNNHTGAMVAYRYGDLPDNVLINEKGEVISDVYSEISNYGEYALYKVEDESIAGVHDEGMIDGSGNVIIPLKYADIKIISDRWQCGVKLIPSTEDDKDYTFTIYGRTENTKEYYRIDTVDFYFDGHFAGTLSRSDYGDGYATAYGAYLMVTNRAGYKTYYNGKMEQAERIPDYSGEFDSEYKNHETVYYHNGTGQRAFVPEFTVPLEDLGNPYKYDKAVLYDAHGNVVFNAAQNYDSIGTFAGGYAIARMNGKKGLVSLTGEEIIPLEYEELGNYENEYLRFGCISAVKDGKLGFLDANGNVTCDFRYSSSVVKNKTSFATIQDLDGSIIVLSGLAGELPERYTEVSFPSSYGCYSFIGKNADGLYTLVDIYGNTLLPYSEDWRSMDVTDDGTIAVVKTDSYTWRIYTFNPAAPAEPEPDTPEPSDDGTWTCSNGHEGNTGKFCPECGESRPAQQLTACPECGYEFPEGTSPKFCPECGAKLSE